MALITIGSGILLLLVGIAGFVLPETKSWTALIPAALGVVFVVLGAFAFNVAMRKHTMHLAAALGLLDAVLNHAEWSERRCIGPDDVFHWIDNETDNEE